MRRHRSDIAMACGALALAALAATGQPALATPLDAETCARLKEQRAALDTSGVRDTLKQPPPARAAQALGERAQQVRALIDLDGQLRFRCMMDLPIATLRPEPTEEFVDAGDTAGGAHPAVAKLAVKKAKPAVAKAAPPAEAAAAVPAAPKPAAAIKTSATGEKAQAAPTASDTPPKRSAKVRTKADDAYRAPASADANATPLDKQVPKSP